MQRALAALMLSLFFAGCATTTFTEAWKRPGFVPRDYEKILVVALTDRDAARLIFERAMGTHLAESGYQIVYGNEFLPPNAKEMPREELRVMVQEAGIDGAVTMALRTIRKDDRYDAPDEYAVVGGSTQGFYGTYASYTFVKSDKKQAVPKDRILVLEANFYDLKGRPGVMWRATSETKNPEDPYAMAEDYTKKLIEVMSLQGVLKEN